MRSVITEQSFSQQVAEKPKDKIMYRELSEFKHYEEEFIRNQAERAVG